MHEFGHTIGLYHGGNDPDINNKPNYISIMNYLMTNAVVADSKLDFSRCALDTLNERALSEPNGISGITNSCLPGEKTAFYNACAWHPRIGYFGVDPQLIETGNPVDWATPVSGIDSTIKQKNINCDQNDNGQRYTTEMKGYEDWHNLISLPTTPTTTGDTAEDLGGESPVQSSNNETQNLNHIQTNNTNDDIKIKTLVGDEPTRTDITFQTLGVLAGITSYIENNIDESSFQEPTEDLQGNTITSDPFAEGVADPAAAGKEYYQTILGDPLFLLDPSAAESGLGKEEAPKDNVANNIIDGDIDSAIEKLDNLLLASDSSLGGVSSNDRIKNPSDQQELLEKIANLQNILKKQSCTYDRCN
jgi:hypothetical protein